MKKFQILSIVMAGAFLVFQGQASAELISGKVDSVTEAKDSLKVSTENPVTKTTEEVKVGIDQATEYTGVAAPEELKKGDGVVVDAKKDEATGVLKAEGVNATKM